ncbi:hypothetical protein GCM10011390_43270 [Aureimonas endophytica]|uniref:Uncharacterized protein n=1 Tax=Aureimonas endophytica TaxID=2027858 RepID=A0A917EAM1_9HYPH|nr:hypothetical protein [Aureimonas endophytica]GGE19387.1 hypothetical protein GCM10011390_43270 [Aureimonas endophytica]
MADGNDKVTSLTGTRRLADAVRAAKIAAAHRSDVVVDIREADRARLEILAEALQSVIDDIPAGDDFFDFTISGGPQPRFWIDGTAHVTMARDRRTYRFVRETRIGRVTLAESPDMHAIADRITTYIAERIVEREKAFAELDRYGSVGHAPPAPANGASDEPIRAPVAKPRGPGAAFALSWLLIGMVVGAAILYGLATMRGLTLR